MISGDQVSWFSQVWGQQRQESLGLGTFDAKAGISWSPHDIPTLQTRRLRPRGLRSLSRAHGE